jgi:hypothetical protein
MPVFATLYAKTHTSKEETMGQIKFGKGDNQREQVVVTEVVTEVENPVFSAINSLAEVQKPVFVEKELKLDIEKPVFLVKEIVEIVKKPTFIVEELVEVIKRPEFIVETELKENGFLDEIRLELENIKQLKLDLQASQQIKSELDLQRKIVHIGLGIVIVIQLLSLFGV